MLDHKDIEISEKFVNAFEEYRTGETPPVTLNEYHEGLECVSEILMGGIEDNYFNGLGVN